MKYQCTFTQSKSQEHSFGFLIFFWESEFFVSTVLFKLMTSYHCLLYSYFVYQKEFNSIRKGNLDTSLTIYPWESFTFGSQFEESSQNTRKSCFWPAALWRSVHVKLRLLQSPQPLHPSACPRMMTQPLMTQSHMGFSTAPVPFDSLQRMKGLSNVYFYLLFSIWALLWGQLPKAHLTTHF